MARREQVDPASMGIENEDAFSEACAVFGNADALARLRLFRAELSTHLDRVEAETDLGSLREVAHQTAGRAGLLGFPSLAQASARLDEAIRAQAGVSDALDQWTMQARLAVQSGAQSHQDDTRKQP